MEQPTGMNLRGPAVSPSPVPLCALEGEAEAEYIERKCVSRSRKSAARRATWYQPRPRPERPCPRISGATTQNPASRSAAKLRVKYALDPLNPCIRRMQVLGLAVAAGVVGGCEVWYASTHPSFALLWVYCIIVVVAALGLHLALRCASWGGREGF